MIIVTWESEEEHLTTGDFNGLRSCSLANKTSSGLTATFQRVFCSLNLVSTTVS